jgi:F-box protein 11
VVTLLVVIITPGLFGSGACRAEAARFLERVRELGRSDLILPVYYISAREMDDPAARETDELARVLASRQFTDWRRLRFEPLASPQIREAIARLASRMRDSFWHPGSGQARRAAGRSVSSLPYRAAPASLRSRVRKRPKAHSLVPRQPHPTDHDMPQSQVRIRYG